PATARAGAFSGGIPPRARIPQGRNPLPRTPALRKVGVPRFELGTSPTRTERATRLRHTPSRLRVPVPRVVGRASLRTPAVDSADDGTGRDRHLCERAARGRAVPRVRPAGPPGGGREGRPDPRLRA